MRDWQIGALRSSVRVASLHHRRGDESFTVCDVTDWRPARSSNFHG